MGNLSNWGGFLILTYAYGCERPWIRGGTRSFLCQAMSLITTFQTPTSTPQVSSLLAAACCVSPWRQQELPPSLKWVQGVHFFDRDVVLSCAFNPLLDSRHGHFFRCFTSRCLLDASYVSFSIPWPSLLLSLNQQHQDYCWHTLKFCMVLLPWLQPIQNILFPLSHFSTCWTLTTWVRKRVLWPDTPTRQWHSEILEALPRALPVCDLGWTELERQIFGIPKALIKMQPEQAVSLTWC